jgi:hypothetical protein
VTKCAPMRLHDTPREIDEYRLVLVGLGSQGTWTDLNGLVARLPRVTIPRWTRPAEQLQRAIEGTWHTRAIVLDFYPGGKNHAPSAIAEISSSQSPHGLTAVGIDELPETEMTGGERAVIKEILEGNPGIRGPFSRIGWLEEAKAWLCAEARHNVDLSGEIWQYNAAGTFALVRFGTRSGPAYWLKGTGEPNVHEFEVTRILAETCPEFLPTQIAAREDWNAWLMEDAGQPVKTWNLPALERAVLSMASIQMKFVGRVGELLAVGATDQRISTLHEHICEVVEYLNEAMAQQVSSRVPRVEPRRLWQIASILQNACCCMEDLGIPDTLIHNDLNSGNILFSERGCVFTDWCESCVGNPFCAFQQLCLLQPSGTGDWISKLRMIYKNCWLDLLHSSQINAAFTLAPLLAIFSHLYGRGTWLHSPRRNESQVKSYARSLARHMDRAAQDSSLLEAI